MDWGELVKMQGMEISVARLREAWMTYCDLTRTWGQDPDDNDGTDFDAFMQPAQFIGGGDFECCNRTINSELVVGQGDECAIGEDADNE